MQPTQTITLEQIATTIRQFISEQMLYDQPDLDLTDDFPLIEQGVIDSLQIMQLITFLQESLGYVMNPDEVRLENFKTITAIATLVTGSTETD